MIYDVNFGHRLSGWGTSHMVGHKFWFDIRHVDEVGAGVQGMVLTLGRIWHTTTLARALDLTLSWSFLSELRPLSFYFCGFVVTFGNFCITTSFTIAHLDILCKVATFVTLNSLQHPRKCVSNLWLVLDWLFFFLGPPWCSSSNRWIEELCIQLRLLESIRWLDDIQVCAHKGAFPNNLKGNFNDWYLYICNG